MIIKLSVLILILGFLQLSSSNLVKNDKKIISKLISSSDHEQRAISYNVNSEEEGETDGEENLLAPKTSRNKKKYKPTMNYGEHTYIRASIPFRIYQCVQQMTIMRCMKLFLLQKMENIQHFENTGNLTNDFIKQFFYNNDEDEQQYEKKFPNLFDKKYKSINDTELTNRLITNFQKFFKDRDIKLHFLPGVMFKIVPSSQNKINFSLKTITDESTGRRRRRKDKNEIYSKDKIIQMAVPVLMMPAILLGTFLPFMIPALKMATIMSTLLNNGALIAALMYAARTSVQQNDAEVIHYTHPGYH